MNHPHANEIAVVARWSGGGGRFGVLVHGGAGDRAPDEPNQRDGCHAASASAFEILACGGSALDAVQAAVTVLEDDPRYNAGTGSFLTEDGDAELDAAIMDGDLRVGAVCGLRGFRNPIAAARAALEDDRHVLYAGSGAAAFAAASGIVRVHPESLVTPKAINRLERWKAERRTSGTTRTLEAGGGTVGAVARDGRGNVAAATSTGGTTGKRSGRVGDSPIVGAGTYADRNAGAASATGHGEGILRVALTVRAVALLERGAAPVDAAAEALSYMSLRVGSRGGLILVDRLGALGLSRTTEEMPWAAVWDGGEASGD